VVAVSAAYCRILHTGNRNAHNALHLVLCRCLRNIAGGELKEFLGLATIHDRVVQGINDHIHPGESWGEALKH